LTAAYRIVAMSKFGAELLRNNGFECVYIPHGVDTHVYKPVSEVDQKTNREWIEKNTAPINLKLPVKIEPDDFVAFINAANTCPYRKAYPRAFLALQIFLEQNPDAKKDTKLLIHGWRGGGRNLPHLAHLMHIEPHVKITRQHHMLKGLSKEDLAKMYTASDIFLNATQAEGFGVPIIEACACGIPPVTTDFTSMPELTRGHGWIIPRFADQVTCPKCKSKFSYHQGYRYFYNDNRVWCEPDEWRMAGVLAEAYNNPKKVRRLGRKARGFSLAYDFGKINPLWIQLMEEVRSEQTRYGISAEKDESYAEIVKEILEK
jgi:glycosyltransferase involved in cell wall biosynthesis